MEKIKCKECGRFISIKYQINTDLVLKKMEQRGLTQVDLARFLGMTKQGMNQILNNKNGTSQKNLEHIARLLDLQVDDFVEVV